MKILVPLDGSKLSEAALPWAKLLAQGEPAEVMLCRSFEPLSSLYLVPDMMPPVTGAVDTQTIGQQVVDYLEAHAVGFPEDCRVHTRADCGAPADEILARAASGDIVVMASHGRGGLGRWLMGSVTTKVVRASPKPVLVVGGLCDKESPQEPQLNRIMVPLDGSPTSELALSHAVKLARTHEARLLLYEGVSLVDLKHDVVEQANQAELERARHYLQRKAEACEGVEVDTLVCQTPARHGIVKHAQEEKVDLIVMGSHGRSGVSLWMLGSVAEEVLQHSTCPVLIVHEDKE